MLKFLRSHDTKILAGLLVVMTILWLSKPSGHDQVIVSRDAIYQHRIDSLNVLLKGAIEQVRIAHEETELARKDQEKAHKAAAAATDKYENIKKTPVPRFIRDHDLDSALAVLYPR